MGLNMRGMYCNFKKNMIQMIRGGTAANKGQVSQRAKQQRGAAERARHFLNSKQTLILF